MRGKRERKPRKIIWHKSKDKKKALTKMKGSFRF